VVIRPDEELCNADTLLPYTTYDRRLWLIFFQMVSIKLFKHESPCTFILFTLAMWPDCIVREIIGQMSLVGTIMKNLIMSLD